MKLYRRCPRTGFIETIHTEGNYRPKGWSLTPEAAKRRAKSKPRQ